MNKILITIVTFIFCLTSSFVWSADYNKGVTALEKDDFVNAIRELLPLAEKGDIMSQALVGSLYERGQGVPQDYKIAVKWYALAAEQGLDTAQHNLGVMYSDGKGVIQNYKTAIKWFKLSAQQGTLRSQHNLSLIYAKGEGVLQNYIYAHMWANIASSLGHTNAYKLRNKIEEQMTPADISTAQKLARECVEKKYKGC